MMYAMVTNVVTPATISVFVVALTNYFQPTSFLSFSKRVGLTRAAVA